MNYKAHHFWCFVIVTMFSSLIFAQSKPVKFRHLTSRDGLSQNRIFDIVQDNDGFIWIGTEDGLNRYDGYNFEVFKRIPGDSTSLADNFSVVLHVSKDGTLWSGGNFGGLSKYNAENKSFTSYSHAHSDPNSIADNYLHSISEDEKGNLWIGTFRNGFDYMFVNKGKFVHMQNMLPNDYPLREDEIHFIHQDKTGHLWIGASDRVHYFKVNYKNGTPQLQPVQLKNQNIGTDAISIKEDSSGRIWIGTAFKGLFEFDKKNVSLKQVEFKNEKSTIMSMNIVAIETDAMGNPWFGGNPYLKTNTQGGTNAYLFKLDLATGFVQKFSHDSEKKNSLSSNNILSLFSDRTGVMWIGTDLRGVDVYDESVTKFAIYVSNQNESTKLNSPTRGFYLEKGNILWIASQGDGLVKYNRNNESFELYKYDANDPTTISSNYVQSLYDDGKYLWVGTFRGLNRFDKKTKKFKRFIEVIDDVEVRINYNILEINKSPGFLWFGTNGHGLIKFNKNDFTYKIYKYDPEVDNGLNNRANFVRTVWYSDKRPNELWMGTTNGINILNLDKETFRYYNHNPKDSTSLSHPNIMNFYEDDRGFIWIATYGGGLNRFDPKTEKFLRFTEGNSNIPNNGVYGSLPDKQGNLWISTNNGITKFNPVTFKFRNYSVDDGLQSEEFNGGSYHLGYNGEMFFGGVNGFNSFFPDQVTDNKFIPKIVITDLKTFNESMTVGENSPLKQEISKTDEIELESWQNDISFEYVALHYSNPSKNKYAFKLENYEKEWRYVNNIRIATYTNLDPGEYIFRVKGTNNDGLWNEKGKSISIIIHPPWWKTTGAYVGYFFLFVGFVFGIDRVQRRRIVNKERTAAAIKEANLRARIAETENERKSKELEEARQLQLSMLPKKLPQLPHLDIAVYMQTATEVGGDYYDFHLHLDGTLTVLLGDATGHGMQSGMMVSIMKSLFMSDRSNKSLKPFFQNTNTAIKDMELGRLMMAANCVQFNSNKIKVASAGMPSVLIYREQNKKVEEVVINNLPLGALRNFEYEVKEDFINSGDTILLMTDGFAELKNKNSEMIGYNTARNLFETIAENSPEVIIDLLKEKALAWSDGLENEDDITFVVVKIK